MKTMADDELFTIIGENINYYRKLYDLQIEKLTQDKLAEKIDVSLSLISNLESKTVKQGISVPTFYRISKCLNVSLDKLISREKEENISIKKGKYKEISDNELFDIIGNNVVYYRKLYNLKKGKMTQKMLAKKVGIATSVIGALESQKMNQGISVPVMYRISNALNIALDTLTTKRK